MKGEEMSLLRVVMTVSAIILGCAFCGWKADIATGIGTGIGADIAFAAEADVVNYQNLTGVISRISDKEVVIDDVAFRLQTVVDFDYRRFVPGTYVSFRLNADGAVISLTALDRSRQIDRNGRFFGPGTEPPPVSDTPSERTSPPIRRENGVWKN